MRNFARINNYWNRVQANADWVALIAKCDPDLVDKYAPPENAGWRKIDKCVAALRAAQAARDAKQEVSDAA